MFKTALRKYIISKLLKCSDFHEQIKTEACFVWRTKSPWFSVSVKAKLVWHYGRSYKIVPFFTGIIETWTLGDLYNFKGHLDRNPEVYFLLSPLFPKLKIIRKKDADTFEIMRIGAGLDLLQYKSCSGPNQVKTVPLLHVLVWWSGHSWEHCPISPQGTGYFVSLYNRGASDIRCNPWSLKLTAVLRICITSLDQDPYKLYKVPVGLDQDP